MKITRVAVNGYGRSWAFGGRAKRSQFLDCGLRVMDRTAVGHRPYDRPPPACGGQNAQNEPNSAESNVRNEPNFLIADFGPRSEPGLTTSWIADWGRSRGRTGGLYKTNPIWAAPPVVTPHYPRIPSFHHSNLTLIAQNEPNFRPSGRLAWPIVQNEPNLGRSAAGTTHHSTVPLFHHSNSGYAAWDADAVVQSGVLR